MATAGAPGLGFDRRNAPASLHNQSFSDWQCWRLLFRLCLVGQAHDAKAKPFLDYGSYTYLAGVNHGGGKWLNFRGYRDNATDAFLNTTLNDLLNARIDQVMKAGA